MSQDNQFQQYGYDQFLKAPKKQRIGSGSGAWDGIMDKLRSPVVATVALLAAGALFTGIIIMAYPSGKDDQAEIPIIKADLSPIKSEPSEPGGMDVPYSDSTVLSSLGQEPPAENLNKIENLLAQANEDLTSKEEALQRSMGEDYNAPDGTAQATASVEEERIPQERGMYMEENSPPQEQAQNDIIPEPNQAALDDVTAPSASGILQKIDPSQAQVITDESEQKLAETAAGAKPKMHAAATSPETINYVRSVLNENGEEEGKAAINSATAAAISATEEDESEPAHVEALAEPEEQATPRETEIEPSAGAASPVINISPGNYYVQLASITDRGRAASEFSKLQKKFDVLTGLEYRVEEANLDKGTFYRIQAGPFSKDNAKNICDAIKQQKPGGCILVK